MKELLDNPGFIALVGAMFGGVGLRIINHFLNRNKDKRDAGAAIRSELRMEIESLRTQAAAWSLEEQRLQAEVERWRAMCYDLRDQKRVMMTDLMILRDRLRSLGENYETEKFETDSN